MRARASMIVARRVVRRSKRHGALIRRHRNRRGLVA
jgi:hypothetical protein